MKRSEIKRYPLSDTTLKKLEPEAKPYQVKDSGTLWFRVRPNGSKNWLYRYKIAGKWSWKGVGSYPEVTGKQARAQAREWDQNGVEDKSKQETQLSALFRVFVDYKASEGRSANTIQIYNNVFFNHLGSIIGHRDVKQLTVVEASAAIKQIEQTGFISVSNQCRKYLHLFYNWAIGNGLVTVNPVTNLSTVTKSHKSKHHPSLVEAEVGEFLFKLTTSSLNQVYKKAIYLLTFTLARPGMINSMRWQDISLSEGTWTVPDFLMKSRREFICPLSTQCVEILESFTDTQGYVFKPHRSTRKRDGTPTEHMGEITLARQFMSLGYEGRLVPHGCRHMGSTILHDHGWEPYLVESQLAHKLPGVAGVYNQAKHLDRRREMNQWYADHLTTLRKSYIDTNSLL